MRHRKINKIIHTTGTHTKRFHVLLMYGLHTIKFTPVMCPVEWVLVVTALYSHHHGPAVEILLSYHDTPWPLEVMLPLLTSPTLP